MSIVIALLLLVLLKFYLLNLPMLQKIPKFRNVDGAKAYFKLINKLLLLLPQLPDVLNIVLVLSPIVLLVALLNGLIMLLDGAIGLIGSILFSTSILYYLLFATTPAAEAEAKAEAGIVVDTDEVSDKAILIDGHERMFANIFWFILLGPAGACFYWLLINKKNIDAHYAFNSKKFKAYLGTLHALAAWIPARITGLIYALVGNFITGFECWLQCMQKLNMKSSQVLTDCGKAALCFDEATDVAQTTTHLVNRAFIGWVILGIFIALIIY